MKQKQFKNPESEIADQIMKLLNGKEMQTGVLACSIVTAFLLSRIAAPVETVDDLIEQNAEHIKHLMRRGRSLREARMM